jgi:protein phosphatase
MTRLAQRLDASITGSRSEETNGGADRELSDNDALADGLPPRPPVLFGVTQPGQHRASFRDHYLIAELGRSLTVHQSNARALRATPCPQGWLLMVAGGLDVDDQSGRASALAIETMASYATSRMPWLFARPGDGAPRLAEGLTTAVERCQKELHAASLRHALSATAATTLTAAYVAWPNLYVAHVGHSRCYAYRDGELCRITGDHTYLPDAGGLETSPVVDNALGGDRPGVRVDLRHLVLGADDVVFLCTHELTRVLDEITIATQLGRLSTDEPPTLQECARDLIDEAKRRGAADDLTVLIGTFRGPVAQEQPVRQDVLQPGLFGAEVLA